MIIFAFQTHTTGMKTLKKYILIVATSAVIATSLSSCWNKDYYLIMGDDDYSNSDYLDDRSVFNGEFDLDDTDR